MPAKNYCLAVDLIDDAAMIAEYEHYHQNHVIWPEIIAGIQQCGVLKMDIYRAGNRLVMMLETHDEYDLQSIFTKMATLPRQKEWAALMHGFQQKIPYAQPDEQWALMTRIFHLYK